MIGPVLIKDIVTYGASVGVMAYVIYVMLHPEVDERSDQRSKDMRDGRAEIRSKDDGILRWSEEQWRAMQTGEQAKHIAHTRG
jgi:hypothetical protein